MLFRSVLVRHEHDPEPIIAEGVWAGEILTALKGEDGFGYDPIFQPDGGLKTFAEMTLQEKNKIAHRARALEKFKNFLDETQKCVDE